MRWIVAAAVVALAALCLTLALPVQEWRTGDQGRMPLDALPEAAVPPVPARIWIDTDAACGHGPRSDPDDCFAIALLALAPQLRIEGISTVAGNAPRGDVERITRVLAARLSRETGRALPVHSGPEGLRAALEAGPLAIVALGPLTNIAAVLDAHPRLRERVERVVAVMGRRPGHLFHPAEGAGGGMLLGHGPVFRDFNFDLDPRAAERLLAVELPTILVPYDAARGIEITAADLDRLAAAGGTLAWIAERARPWLRFWREDAGRQGFFPFDLLAAALVVEPARLRCVTAEARAGEDDTLFIPFWRPRSLLVAPRGAGDAETAAAVSYCGQARPGLKDALLARFGVAPGQ